jgi:hypothetical protein
MQLQTGNPAIEGSQPRPPTSTGVVMDASSPSLHRLHCIYVNDVSISGCRSTPQLNAKGEHRHWIAFLRLKRRIQDKSWKLKN